MSETLFLVENDDTVRTNLKDFFHSNGYHVIIAKRGCEAASILNQSSFDLMVSDIRLPGLDGLELLKRVIAECPGVPVILVTANATLETAIQALRLGAADYLIKPIHLDDILRKVKHAIGQARCLKHSGIKPDVTGSPLLIGQGPAITKVRETIRHLAPTDSTVLITGESGTGKELIAKMLHYNSRRSTGRFVPINCGAIPETLLESELFGHRKGAFTGAYQDHSGLFEAANGGVLLLDEISSMPLTLQAKLLRVVEDRLITPVGSVTPRSTNVRMVSATNRDLRDMVAQGTFRDDLYFRLNVVEILAPPLRDRREDIPLLVAHFIGEYNRKFDRMIRTVSPEAMETLVHHHWPGNIRELRNTVERAMVYCDRDRIGREDLPRLNKPCPNGGVTPLPDKLVEASFQFERTHIHRVLSESSGDKREAASRLGIGLASLYRKLGK